MRTIKFRYVLFGVTVEAYRHKQDHWCAAFHRDSLRDRLTLPLSAINLLYVRSKLLTTFVTPPVIDPKAIILVQSREFCLS